MVFVRTTAIITATVVGVAAGTSDDERRMRMGDPERLCIKDTGGTCAYMTCDTSRGNAQCSPEGKCLCPEGFCAYDGTCVKTPQMCSTETLGTCAIWRWTTKHLGVGFFPCDTSRLSSCNENGKCECAPGKCSANGRCVSACEKDAGQNCPLMDCSNVKGGAYCHVPGGYAGKTYDKGPTSTQSPDWEKFRCRCPDGKCALNGECVPGYVFSYQFTTSAPDAANPVELTGNFTQATLMSTTPSANSLSITAIGFIIGMFMLAAAVPRMIHRARFGLRQPLLLEKAVDSDADQ